MATVEGIKELKSAVARHQGRTGKGLRKGLYKAGLFLQRESQKIVPIDKGILRASAFTRMEGQGFNVSAVVGYTANYALFVHEDLEARHKPGKQAKYLEQPLREKRPRIIEIVKEEIQKER